ncbi:MAG: hypothetical protein ACK4PR_11260, partial [Gammaproteobacteria bacterium]
MGKPIIVTRGMDTNQIKRILGEQETDDAGGSTVQAIMAQYGINLTGNLNKQIKPKRGQKNLNNQAIRLQSFYEGIEFLLTSIAEGSADNSVKKLCKHTKKEIDLLYNDATSLIATGFPKMHGQLKKLEQGKQVIASFLQEASVALVPLLQHPAINFVDSNIVAAKLNKDHLRKIKRLIDNAECKKLRATERDTICTIVELPPVANNTQKLYSINIARQGSSYHFAGETVTNNKSLFTKSVTHLSKPVQLMLAKVERDTTAEQRARMNVSSRDDDTPGLRNKINTETFLVNEQGTVLSHYTSSRSSHIASRSKELKTEELRQLAAASFELLMQDIAKTEIEKRIIQINNKQVFKAPTVIKKPCSYISLISPIPFLSAFDNRMNDD